MGEDEQGDPRRQITRNRSSFLLGASWSHHPSFVGPRLTHFYLGFWVLTVRTGGEDG